MHLTYHEIRSQYEALDATARYVDGLGAGVKRLLDRARPRAIAVMGCGSSYSLAKSVALASWMNLKVPSIALPAGDYLLHPGSYGALLDGALCVTLSRSGSTSEVVSAVERMKADTGAHVLSLCAAEGSPLAALSDLTLEMPWCFDRSVCQTRTVSCLYLAGMLLVARLSANDALRDGLLRAVEGGPAYLERIEGALGGFASKPWSDALVLADAELAGIAEEGALAFQEICQRPGNFHHVLDVRHGPMVLVGPRTLAVAAMTDGNKYERALVADIAKKGAELIVYSDIPLDGLPDGALNVSFGRSLPHAARGLPLILIAQLLAYHRAVADGVDPDKPAGLDPWIRL